MIGWEVAIPAIAKFDMNGGLKDKHVRLSGWAQAGAQEVRFIIPMDKVSAAGRCWGTVNECLLSG